MSKLTTILINFGGTVLSKQATYTRETDKAEQQIKDLIKELIEPYHKPECNYWPITDSIGRRGVTVSGGNCDCGLEETVDEL